VIVNDFYHGIQWRELGAPHVEALPISAIDPDFHHPFDLTAEERAQYTCEVGVVGTFVPNKLYSERIEALEAQGVEFASAYLEFQIVDDRPGVSQWFTVGEHLVTYRDLDHLRELVRYYLDHDDERQRIAAAGQAHVYAHHTYDQRMARLLALLEEM
jgi:spore maturation protein CgeB